MTKKRCNLQKYAAILALAVSAIVLLPTACSKEQQEEEEPIIPVTGITLNQSTATLLVGATMTLDASVEPAEAPNKTVTWSTSDDQIATVSPAGEITAVAPGTATIIATTDDGKFTATCTVNAVETNGISMTTLASEVLFIIYLSEVGDVTVDWGDGEKSKQNASSSFGFSHSYSGASEHRITITGDITSIEALRCSDNQLTTLDVRSSTALRYLECMNNQLTTFDVSHNTALEYLYCNNNQLTALDVSGSTALQVLYCYYNQLTTLDVSGSTALRYLYCYYNQLTTLDATCNTEIEVLKCSGNQLTTFALNYLFRTLHDNTSYTKNWVEPPFSLFINDNPGSSDCDVTIAQEKGWKVYR